MTRQYRRPRNTNVIQLRDSPASLAEHWERTAIPELMQSARYYKAILALKPNIKMVLDVWFRQRDDFDLFVRGTADPKLFETRKRALEERERAMAGILQEIIEFCEERSAEPARKN